MKKKLKNLYKTIIKENSLYLVFLTLAELVISVICTLSFVYSDSLTYANSVVFQSLGLESLLQTLYSSTFWALILVMLSIIVIMSITTLVFKKMEYLFIGILCWGELFILSINLTKSFGENLSTCALFIPIIIINIICYKKEKEKISKKVSKK
jgi:hypothetical protein